MDEVTRIQKLTAGYPRFADGRIDYSNERVCFVLNCVVVSGNWVLLTKRSDKVIAYPGAINGISGFIDNTSVRLEELAKNELSEEVAAPIKEIQALKISQPFIQVDDKINREWHVYAVLVEFSRKFKPSINWENKQAKWYKIAEARSLELLPGFAETMDAALKMR